MIHRFISAFLEGVGIGSILLSPMYCYIIKDYIKLINKK